MKFITLFLLFISGCAGNQILNNKNYQKIVLESGVEIIIKNRDILPIKVVYKNKLFLITEKNGKLIVKNIGIERKKPSFNNY